MKCLSGHGLTCNRQATGSATAKLMFKFLTVSLLYIVKLLDRNLEILADSQHCLFLASGLGKDPLISPSPSFFTYRTGRTLTQPSCSQLYVRLDEVVYENVPSTKYSNIKCKTHH